MKKFLPLILAATILSCKQKKQPEPPAPIADSVEVCTFGLDSATIEQNREAAAKKPIKPTPVPPSPTPVTGSNIIFLDFDGHNVSGTKWNYQGDFYCGPSGLDSVQALAVYNKMKYDFREFNVAVTTDSAVYAAAPLGKKIRVVFTISWERFGRSGGISFVGSFKYRDDSPAFVFTSLLGYNTKYIMEAGSHEAGHSLGLYHQSKWLNGLLYESYRFCYCTATGGYECCDAAPIMGNSYYNDNPLWITGRNSNNVLQDDKKIIASYIGLK